MAGDVGLQQNVDLAICVLGPPGNLHDTDLVEKAIKFIHLVVTDLEENKQKVTNYLTHISWWGTSQGTFHLTCETIIASIDSVAVNESMSLAGNFGNVISNAQRKKR